MNTKKNTLYLMAGCAGSGKSYMIKKTAYLKNLEVVNCDSFKESHPDYDSKNPAALHAWSSIEATKAFYAKLAGNDSFVFDGTGTKSEKYVKMISDAHSAGFKVVVVYVKVSLETSLRRNTTRERKVPEQIVREQHSLIATAMEIISGYADEFIILKNN